MASTETHSTETDAAWQSGRRLLIREPEVARLLAVTPRTVENLRARGDLPSVKIGRSRRYVLADVMALIERSRVPLNEEEPTPDGSTLLEAMPPAGPGDRAAA
jgi:excisionase family DNA binding protein